MRSHTTIRLEPASGRIVVCLGYSLNPIFTMYASSTTRRITRIEPLQAAKIYGLITGLISLVFVPFFLLFSAVPALLSTEDTGGLAALGIGMGLAFMVILPVVYAFFGFIFGFLSALIYNAVAKRIGGIEVEVE